MAISSKNVYFARASVIAIVRVCQLALGSCAFGALLAGSAAAQTAPSPDLPAGDARATGPVAAARGADGVQDIIVTARRRSESLQNVPAAITAFTADRIDKAGITHPADFIAQTANVTLVQTQNAGTSFVVIRGVSQARGSEPSVAVVVDGVQQISPSQFNQELFDVAQIEVLKGPQGGLYGRNAIGGAIVITTKQPTDQLEGRIKVGIDNGFGYKVQAGLSGPLTKDGDVKFRVGGSYYHTKGYIPNVYLHENADPVKDFSGHANIIWQATPALKVDLRGSVDLLRTQGLYFNIVQDVNDVSVPVQVNNRGMDNRDIYDASLKLDYDTGAGVFTSITAYDNVREIVTGDGTDFKPIKDSLLYKLYGFDINQSYYTLTKALSEDFRFASPANRRVSFVAGAYAVRTDKFVSSGNLIDTGNGVTAVYHTPSTNPLNPQLSFLADGQKNFAWALYGNVTANIVQGLDIDGSLRYDSDHRKQTTLTPTAYLPNVPGFPQAHTGDVRQQTFKELQPKVTLRYRIAPAALVYATYGRGFRSGGFNQTGVAAISAANGNVGIRDSYDAEVANTVEVGVKTQWLDRRLDINLAAYTTKSTNGYFFFYLATNGTQNLGNIPETRYKGFEIEVNAHPVKGWDINAGFGYTDSKIRKFPDPTVIGNQAPLVSQYTANLGTQYKWALGASGIDAFGRVDYQRIGKTWFDVHDTTVRRPIDLVDVRVGIERGSKWSLAAWSKNLTNKLYNAEYAPGGFVFKAEPRRYGLELSYNF